MGMTEKRGTITLFLRKSYVNIQILTFMTSKKPDSFHTACFCLFLNIWRNVL